MAACIMAINDSQEILEMFRDLLSYAGYETALYRLPHVALSALENVKPDLILLDWVFGREDLGMEVLQRLKLDPATSTIPVVVCSAAIARVKEIETSLHEAGVAILYKPFEFEALLDVICSCLDGDGTNGPAAAA